MQIHLNGQLQSLTDTPTLIELLDRNGYGGRRIAVEINQAIIPRSEQASYRIVDGDHIEIVQAIGGG